VFRRHAILGPYILLRQLLRLIHLSCQLHTTIAFEVQPQRFLSTNYISIRFYITGTLFRDKTNDETIYIIEQRRPVFALSFSRRRGRLFICIAYSSYYSHYVTRYGLKIHIRLWLDCSRELCCDPRSLKPSFTWAQCLRIPGRIQGVKTKVNFNFESSTVCITAVVSNC